LNTRPAGAEPDPLVFVCQVFHPDAQSTSQLLSDLVRELAGRGEAIEVLCGYPGVSAGLPAPAEETWSGARVRRGGSKGQFKRSFVRRAWAYASYSAFVLWRLALAPRGRRVVAITNPPYHPVLLAAICRLKGHACVALLQDIYPEGLVAVGRLRAGHPIARVWHRLNRRAFRFCHEIWVLGRDMADLVQTRYGVPATRIRVIPHWSVADSSGDERLEETRLFGELGLEGKFVVQYSGNMGLWHDLETIVRAAHLLRDDPDTVFLLIGAGIKRAGAERLAAQLGVTNIRWLPYQPRERLADSLACCHVALVSQLEGLEGIAVPCKLYGILGAGRAVLAQVPARSEVALAVTEENCGLVIAPGDAPALAAGVRQLARDRPAVAAMGRRALAAYREKYSLARGADNVGQALAAWNGADARGSGR
jgi:glycosyltransferase involved in cell wall biosynthesis